MSTAPLKIAFAGFRHGHIEVLYSTAEKHTGMEIVGLCEEDSESREKLTERYSFTHSSISEMIQESGCDAVAVGDYYSKRGAIIIEALGAGKHVISDKPICTSLEELDTIESLVREKELSLGCMLDLRDGGGMRTLKRKVRAIGVSAHSIEPFRYIMNNSDIDVCFPTFNMHSLGINDGTVDEMADVMEDLHSRGKGIYAMKPLGGGHLSKNFTEALDFVRSFSFISSVAIGMKHESELKLNLAYFQGETIDEPLLENITGVERKLVINRLCKRCGLCVNGCEQGALSLGEEKVEVDTEKCIFCGYCGPVCPQFAIRIV